MILQCRSRLPSFFLLSAVLPGVAMASLNAGTANFGIVPEGVAVTKAVTVTNTLPFWHYLLDTPGSGSTVTVLPGSCPSGATSASITTCQVQVTLPAGVVGSGTDSVDIDYRIDDMPFTSDDTEQLTSSFTISVTYGVVLDQLGSDIDGEGDGDRFGHSISLSSDGTRVAIGAPTGNGNDSGRVTVYDWNGSAWTQLGADIDGEAAYDYSGYSVSLSSDGTRVAIGANANDGNGANAGHVRVYGWNGTAWTQLGTDIDGEAASDLSGSSVSLSSDGTRVAIGAYLNDGANGNDSGHVRVYRFASASSAPTPVPTLPLFGLGILVSLLGLFGLRKLRQ